MVRTRNMQDQITDTYKYLVEKLKCSNHAEDLDVPYRLLLRLLLMT